jgi:hypothetical protein
VLVKSLAPKVLVLAAGNGDRWENYRGTAKHFLKVEGEVLIERTVRQLKRYTNDIVVVGSSDAYTIEGASLYIPQPAAEDTDFGDVLKFYSSMTLWSSARTVLVFGDVYFTDEAVDQIMSSDDSFTFLLRDSSDALGGSRREVFAISFDGSANSLIRQHMLALIRDKSAPRAGGWALYKSLTRPSWDVTQHCIKIDDWTTDFDYPKDLDEWERKRPS